MRVRKEVKIDEKEFVVRELTIREIIDFFQSAMDNARKAEAKEGEEKSASDTEAIDWLKEEMESLMKLALEGNHSIDELYSMAPSELKKLYNAFEEANQVFFDIAARTGVVRILEALKDSIMSDFSGVLANSLKQGMGRKSLTMGTPTTSPQ